MGETDARSQLLGIAEIAEALGARPATVAQWHRRGKLPPPDGDLRMGPVWTHDTIQPWVQERRAAEADQAELQRRMVSVDDRLYQADPFRGLSKLAQLLYLALWHIHDDAMQVQVGPEFLFEAVPAVARDASALELQDALQELDRAQLIRYFPSEERATLIRSPFVKQKLPE